ncbi:hypothetical protein E2L09_05180 [Enterococcus hirae]|uniref:hypothetical protein n=1 Tax=Enterococcus hirae TaxID=1354 RepID=UPI0013633A20|nr:hypothetical protein [Enterococcus hirae]NBJ43081.1 hypothetical protein [Enterococcus hirae]QIV89778.1 hypothetical protein E2L09_05180 [Enterococcus hirae]
MTWTKEKLPAGTYFVYTKIAGAVNDDPELQAYLTESLWVEQQVEVPLEMIFESKTEGAFDTALRPNQSLVRVTIPLILRLARFKILQLIHQLC